MAVPCALAGVAAYVPRLRGAAVSARVIAVLLDAPAFLHTPVAPPAAEPRQLHARDDEILARLDGARDRWRVYDEFVLGERVGQRRGVRDFRGYPAIDPLTHHRYFDVLEHARRDPAILAEVNVRWVLHGSHFRFGPGGDLVTSLPESAFIDRGGGLFEARHPAPLVAWYGAVTLVGDSRQVLPTMRAIADAGQGARRRAVIEPDAVVQAPPLIELMTAAPGAAAGELVSYEPDAIAISVDAPRAGIVVLNELAFPGWSVEVDGRTATPIRANYAMRAVYVGAGRHAIRWRFAPPRFHALIAGYLLALAVMLAAAVVPRRPGVPAPGRPAS
jgi:hypothetical protein